MRLSTIGYDIEERDRLVTQHTTLVRAMAQRLAHRLPSHVEVDDLISVGVLGLMDAASRYRADLGVPFDAFARRRIHGAMLDALRELDWAPRSLRRLRRELEQVIARLRHTLGREPEEAEIAEEMRLTPDEYARTLDDVRRLDVCALQPLDATTPGGTSLLDIAIDPDDDPHVQLERAELKRHLALAIEALPDRERRILTLYYGEELTMAEVGAVIGVCESRVSQLRSLAVSRLRATLRATLPIGAAR